MKYLFIFYFLFSYILLDGQGIIESRPVVWHSNMVTTQVKVKSETSIDELLNIIKFEKGDTILTPNSLLKLNQLIFSYPDYGFKIIGLNNKAAYFIERRWKAIRNHLLKSGCYRVTVLILASGSLKSFKPNERCINIVIFGD